MSSNSRDLSGLVTDVAQCQGAGGDSIRTVEAFLNALQADDFDTVEALSGEHLEWLIAGLGTIRGRRRIMKVLRAGEGRFRTELKTHRVAADGGTVIMERTDAWIVGNLRMQLWACGVFEVKDGRVTLWRDYFDYFALTRALVRGLIGLAIPAARPSF